MFITTFKMHAMKMRDFHVLPTNKGWEVKQEGADKPIVFCFSIAEALYRAKNLADRNNCEVIVHDKKGQIMNPNRGYNPMSA